MKRLPLLLLAALLPGIAQAVGYYFNAADSLDHLRLAYDGNDPGAKAAYFRGYVAGVADSVFGNAWCPPSKVDTEQIYRIVSKFMREHPATANQDASAVVISALGASFPCRNK